MPEIPLPTIAMFRCAAELPCIACFCPSTPGTTPVQLRRKHGYERVNVLDHLSGQGPALQLILFGIDPNELVGRIWLYAGCNLYRRAGTVEDAAGLARRTATAAARERPHDRR